MGFGREVWARVLDCEVIVALLKLALEVERREKAEEEVVENEWEREKLGLVRVSRRLGFMVIRRTVSSGTTSPP